MPLEQGVRPGVSVNCEDRNYLFLVADSILVAVVNDYRGILQRPNLFFQDWIARFNPQPGSVKVEQDDVKFPKKVKGLALYSGAHPIKAGTELCASYGKGWWAARANT